ncbi:hypothetical protein OF83DRAFT_1042019, partial [Amylostereum chailletii]
VISEFVSTILRYNRGEGLFGSCEAYFGTVEAQGRGTLHCHMLIWMKGNLSPQKLRDKMNADATFKSSLFGWLETIIKCELPDMEPLLADAPVTKPTLDGDPRTAIPPICPETMNADDLAEFEEKFKLFVRDLAVACNWHEHRDTCWKYLKPGEPRDDAHCRMRVDGSTRSFTELDEETGSILLRRLHPWINNFNDVVLFLLQSNMDIKFIGSGPAAKALVYYITDYITKSGLSLYHGLQAILAAIKKTKRLRSDGADSEESRGEYRRSFLIRCINAMTGRLELSSAQVMSFIVGGGDYYTSHSFAPLYWGDMDHFFPPS